MASNNFQYRALFEYKQERDDDISLQPGDLLTIAKTPLVSTVAAAGLDYRDSDKQSPRAWLHGTNERSKEKGDFPGTFVEYLEPVTWARPVPLTHGGQHIGIRVQPSAPGKHRT